MGAVWEGGWWFEAARPGGRRERRPTLAKRRKKKAVRPSQVTHVCSPSPSPPFLSSQGATTAITEPTATKHMVACFGMFYGGLAQLIAGIFDMKKGSTFGATGKGTMEREGGTESGLWVEKSVG